MPGWHGLTVTAPGRLGLLVSECSIRPATLPNTPASNFCTFKGVWDTGASNSVITQDVIDQCGLKPTGMTEVHGVHGKNIVETFLVDLTLAGRVTVTDLRVTKGNLFGGLHVLIGLDVINWGDFSVTNVGGNTTYSFRAPSQERIDYVERWNAANAYEARMAQQKSRHGGKKAKKVN